jgi:hypothetical protein
MCADECCAWVCFGARRREERYSHLEGVADGGGDGSQIAQHHVLHLIVHEEGHAARYDILQQSAAVGVPTD